jgi:hypothetical protein
MEVRLEDAIGTVHDTICSYMQNFITTTCIKPCSRALLDESTPVFSKNKDFFALLDRIIF